MTGGKGKKRKHVSDVISIADDKTSGVKPPDLTTKGKTTSIGDCEEKYIPVFGKKLKQADAKTPNKNRTKLNCKPSDGCERDTEVSSHQITSTEYTTESKEIACNTINTSISAENKRANEFKALDKDGHDQIKEHPGRNLTLNENVVEPVLVKKTDLKGEGEKASSEENVNLTTNESRMNQRRPEELGKDNVKMEAATTDGVGVSESFINAGSGDHLKTDDKDYHGSVVCTSKVHLSGMKEGNSINDGILDKDCTTYGHMSSENGDDNINETKEQGIKIGDELGEEQTSVVEGTCDVQDHGIKTENMMPDLKPSDRRNDEQVKTDCLINLSVQQMEGRLANNNNNEVLDNEKPRENLSIPEVQHNDCLYFCIEGINMSNIDTGQNDQVDFGDCEKVKMDGDNRVGQSQDGEIEKREFTTVSDQSITDGANGPGSGDIIKENNDNVKSDGTGKGSESLHCNKDRKHELSTRCNVLCEAEEGVRALKDWIEDTPEIHVADNCLNTGEDGMTQADRSGSVNNLLIIDQRDREVLAVGCRETRQSVMNLGQQTEQIQSVCSKGACNESIDLESGSTKRSLDEMDANNSILLNVGDIGKNDEKHGNNVTEGESNNIVSRQDEEESFEIREGQVVITDKNLLINGKVTTEEITSNSTKGEKDHVRDMFVSEQFSDSVMSKKEQEVIRECMSELSAVDELEEWTDSQLIQLDEQLMENKTNDNNVIFGLSSKSNSQKQLQCKNNKPMIDEKRKEGTTLLKSLIRDVESLNDMIIHLRRQVVKYQENLI